MRGPDQKYGFPLQTQQVGSSKKSCMSNTRSERWQDLCQKIVEEKDPSSVSQLVEELLKELNAEKRSLTPDGHSSV